MNGCQGCRKGMTPVILDAHGTLSRVSGLPGRPGHAVDEYWWYCDPPHDRFERDPEPTPEERPDAE